VEILWWWVPAIVATSIAMAWVSWLGRAPAADLDPQVGAERLARAMAGARPMPYAAQQPEAGPSGVVLPSDGLDTDGLDTDGLDTDGLDEDTRRVS
jgi:hypothetical protein